MEFKLDGVKGKINIMPSENKMIGVNFPAEVRNNVRKLIKAFTVTESHYSIIIMSSQKGQNTRCRK